MYVRLVRVGGSVGLSAHRDDAASRSRSDLPRLSQRVLLSRSIDSGGCRGGVRASAAVMCAVGRLRENRPARGWQERALLASWLRPSSRVWEWGTGASTLYFAQVNALARDGRAGTAAGSCQCRCVCPQ